MTINKGEGTQNLEKKKEGGMFAGKRKENRKPKRATIVGDNFTNGGRGFVRQSPN